MRKKNNAVTSACFSPDGSLLVLPTTSGKWFVMDSQIRDMYAQHTDRNEPIQVNK